MINIRSIKSIRKRHNFVHELQSIPAANWMTSKQLKKYDKTISETVEKLKVIDNNLELMMSNPNENIRLALGRAFHLDGELSSVKELKFYKHLPQGRVQIQHDLIETLVGVAKGEKSWDKDIDQEMKKYELQGMWEANPKIGTITIDSKETELRLQGSLGLFSDYLNTCEHEFYKQALSAKLGTILHEYNMMLWYDEHEGKKTESKLIKEGDFLLTYSKLTGLTDEIYYRRGRDFLGECKKWWDFLDDNKYSKVCLLRFEDIHPQIKWKKQVVEI